MHRIINLTEKDKEKIRREITTRHSLFTTYKTRKERLLHIPFRTSFYYIVSILSHIKPFRVRIRTLWKDSLSFFMPEGNAIFYYGFFEANVTNLFLRLLQKGDVFVDVGAHVGFYSNLCSHLVGEHGKVYAFEPTPRTFSSLQRNVHGFTQTYVHNAAALDTETTISFVDYGPKYSAFNSFNERTDTDLLFLQKEKRIITAKTMVLDTYFEEHSITPTCIKIDAEGADYLVLKGLENTLHTKRPLISLEIAGGEEWSDNHKNSIDILKQHDYMGYNISTEGFLYPSTLDTDYSYENVLFVPKEKTSSVAHLLGV